MSGLNAILWTQTELTPPAPITRTVLDFAADILGTFRDANLARALPQRSRGDK
jgi:hypothetical protein